LRRRRRASHHRPRARPGRHRRRPFSRTGRRRPRARPSRLPQGRRVQRARRRPANSLPTHSHRGRGSMHRVLGRELEPGRRSLLRAGGPGHRPLRPTTLSGRAARRRPPHSGAVRLSLPAPDRRSLERERRLLGLRVEVAELPRACHGAVAQPPDQEAARDVGLVDPAVVPVRNQSPPSSMPTGGFGSTSAPGPRTRSRARSPCRCGPRSRLPGKAGVQRRARAAGTVSAPRRPRATP
jgi:hypothetical protein